MACAEAIRSVTHLVLAPDRENSVFFIYKLPRLCLGPSCDQPERPSRFCGTRKRSDSFFPLKRLELPLGLAVCVPHGHMNTTVGSCCNRVPLLSAKRHSLRKIGRTVPAIHMRIALLHRDQINVRFPYLLHPTCGEATLVTVVRCNENVRVLSYA